MLLLVQMHSLHRSAAGGRLFAEGLSSRCPFFFQVLNRGPQPLPDSFFGLVLIAVPI
jgi:hypothetical protein